MSFLAAIFHPAISHEDLLPPATPDLDGYVCEPGDVVTFGQYAGLVLQSAEPSPFYGDYRDMVYVASGDGADYWPAAEVKFFEVQS